MKKLLIFISLTFFHFIQADYEFPVMLGETINTGSNQIYIEPRFCRAVFSAPDIKQRGSLYGVRGSYDLIIYNAPYIGLESQYMSGNLSDAFL